ncbi:uncharacterized protein LOC101744227 isoform X1 [Bombyx mori]|uniref:uncharacterized protein LOC101744227 isoform X1 n=1 Tax=Bombyx mori TaxID=7091 RepID=UPI002ECFF8AB
MKAWTAHEQDTTLSCCRALHVKHAAYASALYTLNISILVVLLYSWRIGVNAKRYKELDDVYYGVQIAYFAIIGTQMFMIVLSIFLFYGIYKENVAFLVPWVVGCMTFMALEAMAMVYSNILRDHVNKADEHTDHLMVSGHRHSWTSAMPGTEPSRCLPSHVHVSPNHHRRRMMTMLYLSDNLSSFFRTVSIHFIILLIVVFFNREIFFIGKEDIPMPFTCVSRQKAF